MLDHNFVFRSGLLRLTIAAVIALLAFCIISHDAEAQSRRNNLGRNFYVAYGANEGGDETDNLMAVYITSRVPASGMVTVPGINFSKAFTTTPGQITTIILPSDLGTTSVEITQSEVVLPGMAVHIVADTDVAVYGMNHKTYSSDAFMALPVNVLGTEYRTMNFPSSSGGGNDTPGEFLIVGVFDSTHVTITPAATTLNGRPANVPFTIVLNPGEVYMVQGEPSDGTNDLTGSHIESDQPVAVLSGHKRTQIPENGTNQSGQVSRDHLIEQLPPVSAWGDSALVVPYATSVKPDLVRIISAEDNNKITVNGAVVGTFNAGKFYEIMAIPGVTTISATNPIMVGQYMHTSWGTLGNPRNPAYGDPALALVYPVEQFDTSYTIVSVVNPSAYTGNFVNLVVSQPGIATLTLDGTPVGAANFKAIPGSAFWYAQVRLQQGTHNLRCPVPFGATVYALGNVDSYSYTGGTQINTITPLKTLAQVIDFGDRLLKPDLSGAFDSIVPITNISSDPVDIYGFPRHLQDTGKFYVTTPSASQAAPLSINPGQAAKITIEFNPQEVNRRMHTQLIANTVHLRAYVVDVYGRGVIDQPQAFNGINGGTAIDTVDFGTFTATDARKDSIIYLGNIGTAKTVLASTTISGNDLTYFSGAARMLPFPVDTGGIGLRDSVLVSFTPGAPNGLKVALLTVTSQNGMTKKVVLIAHVETVAPLTLSTPSFDTTLTCKTDDQTITITNQNDIAVRVDSIVVTGPNAAEFIVQMAPGQSIGAGNSIQVPVRFAPGGLGMRSATCTAYFNIPTGASQKIALTGIGSHAGVRFSASHNIHILGGENVEFPVWALDNLVPYQSNGYTLQLHYDPTNISFTDVDVDNTHSIFASLVVTDATPGAEQLTFNLIDGKLLVGGGMLDSVPLVKLKFASSLNDNDPMTYSVAVPVGFDVTLLNSPLAGTCLQSTSTGAIVTLDSTCANVSLTNARDITPPELYLAAPHPNPFNPTTTIAYEIPKEGQVRIAITDLLGRVVAVPVDTWMKPGRYSVRFDASRLASGVYNATITNNGNEKIRRLILAK